MGGVLALALALAFRMSFGKSSRTRSGFWTLCLAARAVIASSIVSSSVSCSRSDRIAASALSCLRSDERLRWFIVSRSWPAIAATVWR